jgi:hypothetical protein
VCLNRAFQVIAKLLGDLSVNPAAVEATQWAKRRASSAPQNAPHRRKFLPVSVSGSGVFARARVIV